MPIASLSSYAYGLGSGDTELAILGTGLSGPQGVEAVFEYNGLYMNVRDWIDTYLIVGVDGFGDADVRDSREVNPQQDGETFFDAFYGGRTIVLNGRIRAHHIHKLRDMQQILRQSFADLSIERPLVIHGVSPAGTVMINCKKVQPIAMSEAQQNFMWQRDFQVSLRASNPRFLSLLPVSYEIEVGEPVPIGILNVGSYFAQPVLTLENGIETPQMINDSTGQELKLSGDVESGETVTIDFARRRMTNQTGLSVFDRLAPDSDWPELAPGNNLLSILSPSFDVDASAILTFHHSYM